MSRRTECRRCGGIAMWRWLGAGWDPTTEAKTEEYLSVCGRRESESGRSGH